MTAYVLGDPNEVINPDIMQAFDRQNVDEIIDAENYDLVDTCP